MPSRRDLPPTPAELLAWLAVAEAPSASGVLVSESTAALCSFGYAGSPPVVVVVPSDRPVWFAHQAPDRWRLEVDGSLLAVSDGTTAVGLAIPTAGADNGVLQVGSALQLINGPEVLLRPDPPAPPYDPEKRADDPRAEREQLAVGDVIAQELLGRACWRWSSPYGTWWLDAQTGVLLQVETPAGEARFLELDLQPIEADRFAVPAELLARAVPASDPFDASPDDGFAVAGAPSLDLDPVLEPRLTDPRQPGEEPGASPSPPNATEPRPGDTDFTVCWWPEPADSRLVEGDPDVPEVLVQLETGGPGTRFWLGVAPTGRPAPALDPDDDDVQVHRWEGDGWTYALSWQDVVSREDLDRLVASVPRRWA